MKQIRNKGLAIVVLGLATGCLVGVMLTADAVNLDLRKYVGSIVFGEARAEEQGSGESDSASPDPQENTAPTLSGDGTLNTVAVEPRLSPAMQYARALQQNDAERVMDMVDWMQQRLDRVQMESTEPAEYAKVRRELRRRIEQRDIEGNQVEPEGIEDRYVFCPGAEVRELASGDVAPEEAAAGARMYWLQVSFPKVDKAPLNRNGKPVESMIVGVCVSKDGRVLKRGIAGNLEIASIIPATSREEG